MHLKKRLTLVTYTGTKPLVALCCALIAAPIPEICLKYASMLNVILTNRDLVYTSLAASTSHHICITIELTYTLQVRLMSNKYLCLYFLVVHS